jgi:hypothetical protein
MAMPRHCYTVTKFQNSKSKALEMQCNTPTYEESSCEKQVRIARIRVHYNFLIILLCLDYGIRSTSLTDNCGRMAPFPSQSAKTSG